MAKNKIGLGTWIILGFAAAGFIVAMGYFSTPVSAFGGHCADRQGNIVEDCLNKNESRIVPITYASGTYRMSRSGTNWRNYVNRERTKLSREKTPQQKSLIRNTGRYMGSSRSFGNRVDTYSHLLAKRRLDRILEAKKRIEAHMLKFE